MKRYALRFDAVESTKDLSQLGDFLRTQVGSYDTEAHRRWVEDICLPLVGRDERRALGWWRAGQMVGDVVLVPRQDNLVEIKNFRVDAPDFAKRGLGHFMLQQTMLEAADVLGDHDLAADNPVVRLDVTQGSEAHPFFIHEGFHEVGRAELYRPGTTEIILQRTVSVN